MPLNLKNIIKLKISGCLHESKLRNVNKYSRILTHNIDIPGTPCINKNLRYLVKSEFLASLRLSLSFLSSFSATASAAFPFGHLHTHSPGEGILLKGFSLWCGSGSDSPLRRIQIRFFERPDLPTLTAPGWASTSLHGESRGPSFHCEADLVPAFHCGSGCDVIY